MHCPNCGCAVRDSEAVCGFCGEPLPAYQPPPQPQVIYTVHRTVEPGAGRSMMRSFAGTFGVLLAIFVAFMMCEFSGRVLKLLDRKTNAAEPPPATEATVGDLLEQMDRVGKP